MEIANEYVYILMNFFKNFLWVAGRKGICHVAADVCVGVLLRMYVYYSPSYALLPGTDHWWTRFLHFATHWASA